MVYPSSKVFPVLLVVSFLAHIYGAWWFLRYATPRSFRSAPVKSVDVHLIGSQQFESATQAPAAPPATTQSLQPVPTAQKPSLQLPPPVVREQKMPVPQTVVVKHFRLRELLDAPENKELKESLPLFAPSEQREQLCNLEVMEQIQIWDDKFNPVRVVAFAFKDPAVRGNSITAEGAAFRSRGEWYKLEYQCTFNPSTNLVTALDFLVGKRIPYEKWEDHFLFAE